MNSIGEKPHKMRSTLHLKPLLFTVFLLSASAPASADDDHASSSGCASNPGSVSFELVHWHDPRIPGNENLKLETHEINRQRALLDMQRKGLNNMIQMPIITGEKFGLSDFYVQLRVGTPPQSFWMVADTGSQLAWLRCTDNRSLPINPDSVVRFYRKLSTTYKPVPCADPRCSSEEFINLHADHDCEQFKLQNCTYTCIYAHGTIIYGEFGTDSVTLGLDGGQKVVMDDVVLGCTQDIHFGADNEGSVFGDTAGILGLSYTPESFLYRATKQYGNKFSYCFMDHNLQSNYSNFITFGSYETSQIPKATLSGPMQRTKLILSSDGDYCVQVEGISVGGQMLPIPAEIWDYKAGGGMHIDTGTSLMTLAKPAFKMIGQEIMKAIKPKYKIVVKNDTTFRYCFLADDKIFEKDVPQLAIHFAGGAVFEPSVSNYVINTNDRNLQCLAMIQIGRQNPERAAIMGNIMQQFHLWEYDFNTMTVGFAPSQCSY